MKFNLKDKVINIPDHKFHYGKLHLILGENGSGKSLLLSVLGRFNSNYQGQIIYKNGNIKEKDIIYIPPEGGLLSDLSIKENIQFLNQKMKIEDEFIKDLINLKTHYLSGGEEALINILKIYKSNKKIYLLDEVSSFLDDDKLDLLIKIIKLTLNKSNIFIFATNDYRFVDKVKDNIKDKTEILKITI